MSLFLVPGLDSGGTTLVLTKKQTLSLVVMTSVLASSPVCQAQSQKPPDQSVKTFTMEQAIDYALINYPAVRAALERISAAQGGVSLARTSYLPRADALWQSNRATRNNIFGMVLPQPVISPISGPVLPSGSDQSVWGSAAGILFSWEPFDFGHRRAAVKAARAGQDQATAEASVTRLDVAVAATNTFMTLLAAQEQVKAARADVDRRQVFANAVKVLVDNELRPGADSSRAKAELARARTRLIRAEQAEQESHAALADILGIAGTPVQIESGPLLELPPASALPFTPVTAHPVAVAQRARVDVTGAFAHVLDRSYYPRFNLQSTVFGRGSGANTDGSVAGGFSGLGLERGNWAVGITVTFPLFDLYSIRARKQIEASNERAETARYDQTLEDLTGQLEKARAALEGARRVAENTPVELQAALDTESQARARYQAGLGTIVDVAEAQGLLVQAETEDALARLAVWNNLASLAAVQGDLQPFIRLLSKSQGGP
jgi:outer membrane protein